MMGYWRSVLAYWVVFVIVAGLLAWVRQRPDQLTDSGWWLFTVVFDGVAAMLWVLIRNAFVHWAAMLWRRN